ncbi:Fur family transcriptional regulator [Suttonella ornithocola]|uniref:Zinc uptake regulation protein n=1 Tax=Suttonella ornithocola TaxID=279832 RepID=A0A380MUS4_9GAMM|nr:transcriptional repressor [Suttonella ornithocola]SUO95796.1 Zinc uptake regulation protein [Suttonella ornithocola]
MKEIKEQTQLLAAVKKHCQMRGARLTSIREQVLRLVLAYPDVVKAYDVLTDLQKQRGTPVAPPTVYRALEFWVEMGVLHRAESLNGFVLCKEFAHEHVSVITNCRECGRTEELPADKPVAELLDFCSDKGFLLSSDPIVLAGLCADCQEDTHEH